MFTSVMTQIVSLLFDFTVPLNAPVIDTSQDMETEPVAQTHSSTSTSTSSRTTESFSRPSASGSSDTSARAAVNAVAFLPWRNQVPEPWLIILASDFQALSQAPADSSQLSEAYRSACTFNPINKS
jgi:hypothetical protein